MCLDHVLFKRKDFTQEEIDRKNELAVAILTIGLSVCKYCGRSGLGLKFPCTKILVGKIK